MVDMPWNQTKPNEYYLMKIDMEVVRGLVS